MAAPAKSSARVEPTKETTPAPATPAPIEYARTWSIFLQVWIIVVLLTLAWSLFLFVANKFFA